MAKYRVIQGQHIQKDASGRDCVYVRGDVVESDADLVVKLVNKFERVQEWPMPPSQGVPFDPIQPASLVPSQQQQPNAGQDSSQSQTALEQQLATLMRQMEVQAQQLAAMQSFLVQQQQQASQAQATASASAEPTPRNIPEYLARLEKMSVKQLQEEAAAEEIDLGGSTNKNEILRLIREASTR